MGVLPTGTGKEKLLQELLLLRWLLLVVAREWVLAMLRKKTPPKSKVAAKSTRTVAAARSPPKLSVSAPPPGQDAFIKVGAQVANLFIIDGEANIFIGQVTRKTKDNKYTV